MKAIYPFLLVIMILDPAALAQTPGFHLIFGNHDGSTVDVYLDDFIEFRTWAATPSYFDINGDNIQDTIIIVHIPLGSDNQVIASRDSGVAYFPLMYWDDVLFTDTTAHSQPGYTNQSLLAFVNFGIGHRPALITYEDTMNVFSFFMRTANDSSLIGQTVCPFIEGYDPANGGVLWGIQDGLTLIIPDQTFSCLYFVDYLAGDANGSGFVNGVDVTYLVAFFKGYGPPPDPMLAGDANGDCSTDVMDVSYIIEYCKGGPEPTYGNCH
jgi:hypothetical protein